ncbi:3-oxoacyl-[acyl-carrier protein] reductase [Caballeronia glathei]|jgi:NAD(P)-dependent dehydrogenase (short-subunit alcohol dehydrogenase family)|uniref:Short-chain dehydrogenase n=1 Tax=Caballeronia glathei TaxID=60547 RepID=A0A069PMC3_9BURK|nr:MULTISPECIES: SDR family oxidoreductase [Burkholderiaceae]KDR41843.1 short-chain dehydrogenase [Caballeronia glathei]TCK43345.1 NAD(P)-dependent dehydrogenase (short-subunit alcohol dehydrogenase family) [Paraburkholderia sp. BL8N3]CDY76414.1 3-oxoacyl-[acyl-carrier protein] reductase [Caballeronia glathei]
MNRFEGKTVLVTGGNSGMGLTTAQAFASEGARVIITGRDTATLAAAKETLGAGSLAIANDAGSVAAARELAQRLAAADIRLDAVFINAGIAKFAPLADVEESMWDQTFDINVKGAFFQIQALAPLLNEGASIVLNGSINARIGMPASSVYAASKAALISLAKTLSADLLSRGVRVNVISPGPVATPLHAKLGVTGDVVAQLQSQIPIGRFGRASEIAATVLHLASPESGFIVGTEIVIDGGMSQL